MNPLAVLAPRSESDVTIAHDELDLAALLEIFGAEAELTEPPRGEHPLRRAGTGLRTWTAHWVDRATYWGASPHEAWHG